MRASSTLKWIGLALLGVAVAAAVAIAASNLASRQIGLASESISAGDALAPVSSRQPSAEQRPRHSGERGQKRRGDEATTETTPESTGTGSAEPAETSPAPSPSQSSTERPTVQGPAKAAPVTPSPKPSKPDNPTSEPTTAAPASPTQAPDGGTEPEPEPDD
jgi:hypothetical protein